ncbi:hypothetical protein QFZ23_003804 [Arthrobacter globiformis]|nr:hypothetical protein [Arthrobacter globiformis]MDQ1059903.1 hypothetical protein [Arthrobacter globiformis]
MGSRGGGRYGRDSRRELRRGQLRVLSYVGLAVLAVSTVVVVMLALR